ncbi:hypothetical protein MNBD_GAMMA11-2254 [hydrothermal vent metagenome]|uniref:Twin-arginine translocation pathway signal n=1 Tax=hydrothermal vent metagenome TaxID=652676 RepID=A0A3B0X5G4_9ZZZZ
MAMSMRKVEVEKAKSITQHFEFIDEFQPALDDELPPAEYIQILTDNEHYQDAVTFLAHALPAREAVWWACVCARHHIDNADEKYQVGLKAAEAWVYDNSEENRRVCEKHAENGEYSTVASWVCAAVFWSGGSIAAADEPVMEVMPYIYAHAVAGSIVSAVSFSQPEPEEITERYKEYIKHGINIANGGNG